jgi:hypothetical protein
VVVAALIRLLDANGATEKHERSSNIDLGTVAGIRGAQLKVRLSVSTNGYKVESQPGNDQHDRQVQTLTITHIIEAENARFHLKVCGGIDFILYIILFNPG